MAHLLGVASLVMGEAGHAGVPVTEDMVIAALLHDAVEDQGGSEHDRPREGGSVAEGSRVWPHRLRAAQQGRHGER